MTIWVAMAAYNEGPRLPVLLQRWASVLAELGLPHKYVIVDDGSEDATASILKGFAADLPATVITHHPNQGLGRSLRDALKHVADHGARGDVVVTMDADNTHPPELLPRMLEQLEQSACDVIIASRYRSQNRSP